MSKKAADRAATAAASPIDDDLPRGPEYYDVSVRLELLLLPGGLPLSNRRYRFPVDAEALEATADNGDYETFSLTQHQVKLLQAHPAVHIVRKEVE